MERFIMYECENPSQGSTNNVHVMFLSCSCRVHVMLMSHSLSFMVCLCDVHVILMSCSLM